MKPICIASEHLVRIFAKVGARDIMGRRDVHCSACDNTVKAVLIEGTVQRPTPTGYYLTPHFMEA